MSTWPTLQLGEKGGMDASGPWWTLVDPGASVSRVSADVDGIKSRRLTIRSK